MHAGWRLPRILAAYIAGCVLLAFGQTDGTTSATNPKRFPTFPIYPPTADADPSVRHKVVVPMPTHLSVERTLDRISVGFDSASQRNVEITVGKKMTIGVKYELRVYATGDRWPLDPYGIGYTSINEPVSASAIHGLLTGTTFINSVEVGVPVPGKRYHIEEDVDIFETDIPNQHLWRPNSRKYKVLWEKRLKTVT